MAQPKQAAMRKLVGSGRYVNDATPLGKLVRASGIRCYQLSAETGISPSLLSKYVNAKRRMSPRHLAILAAYFGCHPEQLQ